MPSVGIVIPTLNEARYLSGILADVGRLRVPTDVVVADGGSEDQTVEVAIREGVRHLMVPRGRASQMNAGAIEVTGEWLCFVHADVRMPDAARRELELTVGQRSADAAVWRLEIDATGAWPRVMEFGAALRDRLGGLPYGDQGLLVRRALFEAVGGFPQLPIMEDVAMVRALKRRTRVRRLAASLRVSPRRWLREGPYRTWFHNIFLISAYLAGVAPRRLARRYRPEPPPQ